MEWKLITKQITSQGYWALNAGDVSGYAPNDSGLWVPDKPYVTTTATNTFLPDNVYKAAVADVKYYFEHGDFMMDNATVYIPPAPKPKPKPVEAQLLGYYPLTPNTPTTHIPSTRDVLTGLFPGLDHMLDCPACGENGRCSLTDLIIHLNDGHEWTRERIADWLETLPVDLTLVPASKGD